MAGLRGKSGPPGNQNAFRHGLAGISQRRNNGALNPTEHSIREEILSGLLAGCERLSIDALLDGEVIALEQNGRISFNLLQHHCSQAQALLFYAFDILIYRGENMMGASPVVTCSTISATRLLHLSVRHD
jgi:hypothetical protein